jgi:hypothetical protein
MKYSDNPSKFQALLNAAQGNIITAIKQLKEIEFPDAEILSFVQQEINRHNRTGIFARIKEAED